MSKSAKRMTVLAFAVIGFVWTLFFVAEYVVIPVGKAAIKQLDKGISINVCKYSREENESFAQCMKKMGH